MIGEWLQPQDHVTDEELHRGLGMLTRDGICSQIMGTMTGGAFLVALALWLGASNKVIGLLAAVGPLTQILQIPAILLVDWTGRRKALVVVSSFLSRLFLLAIAVLPWFEPPSARVPLMVTALLLYFALGSVSGCAFNSWMRDFVPEKIMGAYFGRRMAVSIALGAVVSLAAGFWIDFVKQSSLSLAWAYSSLFMVGPAVGLIGAVYLSRIPEPKMQTAETTSILAILRRPFANRNFRKLLIFMGTWNFAVNLAGPFFTVYMLKRLDLDMVWIVGLAVLSQLANVLFLRLWGRLSDRFTNKSVLTVSGPLFMVSIILWPFTTLPDRYVLTIPLLVAIHALAGMSTAGVSLCSGNIALKLAPRGEATAYLAMNALISGMAATVAPLVGGLAADQFANHELRVDLNWISHVAGGQTFQLPAASLLGLDFLFVISFLAGLYALHRLLGVKEEGEVEEHIVRGEFYAEVRKAVKNISNVAGLRHLVYFPYAVLKSVITTARPRP